MKGYVKPEIHEISDMMETVGLLSGQEVLDDTVTASWQGQDHGTYSEVWIGVKRNNMRKTSYKVQLTLMDPARTMKIYSYEFDPNLCQLVEEGAHHVILLFPFNEPHKVNAQWTIKLQFTPGPNGPGTPDSIGHVDNGSYGLPENPDPGTVPREGVVQIGRGVTDFSGKGNAQTVNGGPFLVQILD